MFARAKAWLKSRPWWMLLALAAAALLIPFLLWKWINRNGGWLARKEATADAANLPLSTIKT